MQKIKQQIINSHPPGTDKVFKKSETFFDEAGNKIEYKEFKKGKIEKWERWICNKRNLLTEIN